MSNQEEFARHQRLLQQQQTGLLHDMQQHMNNPNVSNNDIMKTLHDLLSVMDARSNSLASQYSQINGVNNLTEAISVVQAQNSESLQQQGNMIVTVQNLVQELVDRSANNSGESPTVARRFQIPNPITPAFNGNSDTISFRAFKAKLTGVFERYAAAFETEKQCVFYALSCMTGPPLEHFAPIFNGEVEDEQNVIQNYNNFMNAVEAAYGDRLSVQEAEDRLRFLKQKGTMQEYISEFSTLQGQVRWNQAALVSQFKFGLSEPVRHLLQNQWHSLLTMTTLTEAATTAYQNLRVSSRRPQFPQQQHKPNFPNRPHNHAPASRPVPPVALPRPGPNDMELGVLRSPLTTQEKERRRKDNLCMYCGKSGHFAAGCPNKRPPTVRFNLLQEADLNYVIDEESGKATA